MQRSHGGNRMNIVDRYIRALRDSLRPAGDTAPGPLEWVESWWCIGGLLLVAMLMLLGACGAVDIVGWLS
jgi:hypothetical protein